MDAFFEFDKYQEEIQEGRLEREQEKATKLSKKEVAKWKEVNAARKLEKQRRKWLDD